MKRIQLKEAIKQIVRQAINERKNMIHEVAPPGKKAERVVQHVKKSLRDKHPEWDDEKVTSIAIATAWKLKNKGNLDETGKNSHIHKKGKVQGLKKEAGLTSENGNYSEKAELELIKQIGQKVLELLAMHGSATDTSPVSNEPEENEPESSDTNQNPFETPEDNEPSDNDDSGEEIEGGDENEDDELDEATYKVVSPNAVDTAKEDKARKIQTEPKVSENFKVQTGPSCRTAKDSKNNPKNVRNPKLG